MRTIVLDGESLGWSELRALARDDGACRIRVAPAALRQVARSRGTVERAVAEGRTIYGINTGFGKLSDTRIDSAQLDALQRNLLLSHAAGMGPGFLREVGLLIALRTNSLLLGYSGVTPGLVGYLAKLHNRGVRPLIYEQGSVGASGDLAPLAQLGCAMLGEGQAWIGSKLHTARAALAKARLAPYRFRFKEALSLINGTQFTMALLARVLADAEDLLKLADVAAAMSLEALKGSARPYDARFHRHRPHPGQLATAANVRRLLASSGILHSHRDCRKVQDAYSLRCVPQVHGAARDAWTFARDVLVREANSVTDNPLVFENGDILSGGNFHGQALAQAADFLTASLVSLANISERRIDRMTNPDMSELPAFLVAESGLNSGYMMVQVAAAAVAAECRADAGPASVHSIPTGASKEDHVPMAPIAARKCRRVLDNVGKVVGLELLCAAQGLDFLKPLRPGRGVAAAHARLRRDIPHLDADRFLRPDLEKLTSGALPEAVLAAAEKAVGPLA
ncbi:MAG TPA: histidine ammonia-lyase [Planctomycetota bacterium]